MRRGDIVIAAERSRVGGKPRPWLVVQSDAFNPTHSSVTLCMISTQPMESGLFRIAVEPSDTNGLKEKSTVMVDVLLSASRRSVDARIGSLEEPTLELVNEALRGWLDL